jgi:hypothetical protein
MARGRGRRNQGMGAWVQNLGEQIGSQLGQIIAESVQRSLQSTIDVGDIARQLGVGGRGRGRRGGARAVCSVAGCGRPVLAKGLCRSHYYRARYRAQKAGTLQPKRRGRRASRKKSGGESSASEASSS